jgi:hypothetical protein
MYWGIFDSTITNGLPKEFVELFEYGCKSDNVEVWYKLLYLETFHTGLKVEEILRLIKECVELA